jgi:hypothetical protein
MIKLIDILLEAKWDNIAGRVWDYMISNEKRVTKKSLREISDIIARKAKVNKQGFYEAVVRVGKEKNWLTRMVTHKEEL